MRITFLSLILLTSSAYAMDQEKSPGQQFDAINQQQRPTAGPASSAQGILPRASIASATPAAPVQAVQEQGSIAIVSSKSTNNPVHVIRPKAINFSIVLQSMVAAIADTSNPIPFDFSDTEIQFVAQLLNVLPNTLAIKQTEQQFAQMIIDIGTRYNLTFSDILNLVNFFDISIAFTAIATIHQPLPLPRTPDEAVNYNRQLAYVFNLARQSCETGENSTHRIGSEQLWQLFGRMLYPGCLQFKDIEEMINFITAKLPGGKIIRIVRAIGKKICFLRGSGSQVESIAQRNIEQIVLGKYIMQQHPELYSHRLQKITRSARNVYSVAFSPDGQIFASESVDNTIQLLQVADGSLIRTLTGHTNPVYSVAFSPDGQTLASGSYDGTIRLWRVADGSLIRTLRGHHEDMVSSVAFSPDGQTLASGSNGTIRLWRTSDGHLIRTLMGHAARVYSVAFSPDGQTLASGSVDNTIRLWRVADGSLIRTVTGDTGHIFSVAFSPDGQILASGLVDNTIRLLQVADGSLIRTLTGHTDHVACVAFSPDGQILASGSWDNTIRLWQVADGSLIRTVTGHTGYVLSVAFSPDGQILASGGSTMRLWGYRSLRAALMASIA